MAFGNRARAAQLIDFEGLSWGKIRPTDLDLCLDWGGKFFVFVEVKGAGTPITLGQRIHLESLVRAINAGGRTAVALVATHTTKASEDILARDCIVQGLYRGNVWDYSAAEQDKPTLLQAMNDLHCEYIKEYKA